MTQLSVNIDHVATLRQARGVDYPDPLTLMADLRALGESNALAARRRSFTRRATLLRAAALYAERHGGPEGRVTATVAESKLPAMPPPVASRMRLCSSSVSAVSDVRHASCPLSINPSCWDNNAPPL